MRRRPILAWAALQWVQRVRGCLEVGKPFS